MRKRTLNVFYSWLVVAMVYYGLSFNSKHLGGNRYVNTFVSGFVEVNFRRSLEVFLFLVSCSLSLSFTRSFFFISHSFSLVPPPLSLSYDLSLSMLFLYKL